MELKILNNSLSPSFLIKSEKNILVNTPKGFNFILKDKIDGVLFTSDDMYHTYDIGRLKDKHIPCYIFKEFENNILKKIKENNLNLNVQILKPYKSYFGFIPFILHKTAIGISSNISMGMRFKNFIFLPVFKRFTNKSYELIKDLNLLLTIKYLDTNPESIGLKEIMKIIQVQNTKKVAFIGLSKNLKNMFNKKYLLPNNKIKIN